MSVKSRIRSTAQQLKLLTDYMVAHPKLANGEFTGYQGRLQEQRQWEELQIMLKEHGPDKSIEQWKVTWRDLRRKARTEGSVASQALNSNGNATVVPVLSDQTKKILGVMGIESAFSISGGDDFGIGATPLVSMAQSQEWNIEEITTCNEEVGSAIESPSSTHNEVSQYIKSEEASESLPGLTYEIEFEQATDMEQTPTLTYQMEPGQATSSIPMTRIRDQSPAIGSESINQRKRIDPVKRTMRQRQQETRARAKQFLQAELETNNVLRLVANQLAIANRHRAMRSRFMAKERLWQLRRDLFK